jgi:hypothetical protein
MGLSLTIFVVTVISVISSLLSAARAGSVLKSKIRTEQHAEKNFAKFMVPP